MLENALKSAALGMGLLSIDAVFGTAAPAAQPAAAAAPRLVRKPR
jgi:hypothetical protein